MTRLLQLYGNLLTNRQREILDLYYNQNFSLGELAQEFQVSRQAVHDTIKRTERILENYEAKLSFLATGLEQKKLLQRVEEAVKAGEKPEVILPLIDCCKEISQV
jgi:predicted DNA-binding protein YlxM (UPF0122 family)